MIRKIILSLIASTALSFSAASLAEGTSDHSAALEDLYIKAAELLPQGELGDYPSYASLGNRFNTGGERAFVFDPRNKRWAAYDRDGYFVAGGVANGGADFCAELGRPCHTPVGVHRVVREGTSACASSKFPLGTGGAPMPFCMHFGNGYAIHGSPYISNRNTSHGCIRVMTSAAKWLRDHFVNVGTKIIVLPY